MEKFSLFSLVLHKESELENRKHFLQFAEKVKKKQAKAIRFWETRYYKHKPKRKNDCVDFHLCFKGDRLAFCTNYATMLILESINLLCSK